ncbi:hypothetical protein LAZ67_12002945 [Cordylochernes scorpioides]|uniref:Uncharacterized protein n=1 Tax=Cordylochernes scorpioides TaxID=51811 RepID=A0ABY6L410_9ARAC|nr:hypothetical protein LAZ67_12002945 [Cordylochernes scorpioides]
MPLYQPRVTILCGFTSSFIIGPFFFEKSMEELLKLTSRGAKQLLKDTSSENRVISRHFIYQWPPRSPDLTPCDFWLWGYIKSCVYRCRPTTLAMLKASIRWHIQLAFISEGHSPIRHPGKRPMAVSSAEVGLEKSLIQILSFSAAYNGYIHEEYFGKRYAPTLVLTFVFLLSWAQTLHFDFQVLPLEKSSAIRLEILDLSSIFGSTQNEDVPTRTDRPYTEPTRVPRSYRLDASPDQPQPWHQ